MSTESKEKFVCDICGREFPSKRPLGNHVSWCSGSRKKITRKPGHDPEKYLTKVCPYCGEEFHTYKSTNAIYCCQEHYGLDRKGKPLSDAHVAALRKSNCGKEPWNKNLTKEDDPRIFARGCFTPGHTAWNKGLTKETDERVLNYSGPKSLVTRANMAKASSKRVMEGTLGSNKNYKKGRIVLERLGIETYYHSSYELEALMQLDSCPQVTDVSRGSIRIYYLKEDGSTHYYVPDMLVTTLEGLNFIIEIKPSCFVDLEENQIKFVAAKSYAAKHNMIFLIWTDKILFTDNGVTTALAKATLSATADNLDEVDDTV